MKDRAPAARRRSLPRWLALTLAFFVWLVAIPLAHGGLPWALSFLTSRYGWSDGRPGAWNLVGLIPVTFGVVWLIWVLRLHVARTPERVDLGWTPPYLLTRGPYVITRNPMYVSELALWLGWALFYGSVAVLAGLVVFWVVVSWLVLPREEHALETRFGEPYRQYRIAVPRWLHHRRSP